MATFASILDKIRAESFTQRDKGNRFERLMRNYLRTSAKYNSLLENVWLWEQFPFRKDFSGKDLGIDLVARTVAGEYWAIQCKCYAADTTINKADVDSFLSNSSRTFKDDAGSVQAFAHRLWIATTDKWGTNALESMQNQNPPVSRLSHFDIETDSTVDWDKLASDLYGKQAGQRQSHRLKKHQKKAIDTAHEYYALHDRGKMIMACGTGKTFTSLRLVEQETDNKGLILVLVPSIALINQTLNEWENNSQEQIYPICVCSDSTASRKRRDSDAVNETPVDLALPACTNSLSVAKQLLTAKAKAQNMIVVYSTYQSIEVISKAQKYLRDEWNQQKKSNPFIAATIAKEQDPFVFDFIVCDEAHRTTGVTLQGKDESSFVKVHDNSFLRAKKRLYMTATPRLYSADAKKKAAANDAVLCSMDNEEQYGQEFYRIGFGEAVELGLLADYKVLILTFKDNTPIPASMLADIQDKEKEINTDDAIKLIGCVNALSKRVVPDPDIVKNIDPNLMHRAVAFCPRIKDSKIIAASFNKYAEEIRNNFAEEAQEETVLVSAEHIDGSMNAGRRNELIRWLKNAPVSGNECRILTNVRCLSEGVDVPSMDAVIFLSARNSQVDVVQSVGRVMRNAPGKKYGYIIIPVVVPADGDPNVILDNNKEYAVIWTVLNALRAHDDRFNSIVNQIELNEKKPTDKITIGAGDGTYPPSSDGNAAQSASFGNEQLLLFTSGIQNALYAKMVLKVGTKRYWEQWADDVASIAKRHMQRITDLLKTDEDYKTAFDMYIEGLHKNINPAISEKTAIEMLAQHMITKPVFEALFDNYSFADSNPISKSMKTLLEMVNETGYEKDQATLVRFYQSVKERCEGIDNASGKQKVIVELYDKFFKKALKDTVEKLGIVYTPVEVVDFINKSVADVLKKEFKRSISDENIHVIDPFTGTGTFITRLLQSGLIESKDLARKYQHELHANELVLLAYYIASINIENAYHDIMGEAANSYTPFNGICLTDTFQMYEDKDNDVQRLKYADVFPQNSERVIAQSKVPMRVIIGNPPYSVGQKSANDNAQNDSYPKLERRIAETYAAKTSANNKNSLYDSYIKAFRYASDMLDKQGGVIGFVTNAGWLDGNAMDGLRKCFTEEFSSIYVYNLRGNQRTSGELSRKEGGKIFGSGSRTPAAVVILVKNPKAENKQAVIYYREVADYLTREQKLAEVSKQKSVLAKRFVQKVLQPNAAGDWLNQRSDVFKNFIPLGDKEEKQNKHTFFVPYYSNGLKTQRDAWCYNFSYINLQKNMQKCINFYDEQRKMLSTDKSYEVVYNSKSISWSTNVLKAAMNNKDSKEKESYYTQCMYRPFSKFYGLYSRFWNERVYQIPKLFPTPNHKNLLICVSGVGVTKNFTCIMTNFLPDLELIGKSQCFPLYWYEAKQPKPQSKMADLFAAAEQEAAKEPQAEWIRHDGITDYILQAAREQYQNTGISKEDIFYYVYGLLHNSEYRTQFAADLKKMLPRLPLVENSKDFIAFSQAGRALADLHLDYEKRPAPAEVTVEGDKGNYTVSKMRFTDKTDKSRIRYNDDITIKNIPPEAYEYVVNGRSAIEWIMERYQVKIDKDSQIKNDPNDWSREHDDERYLLDLLLSIITVSVESIKIIQSLPKIKWD